MESTAQVRERFNTWWKGGCVGRPMMRVIARREGVAHEHPRRATTPEEHHLGVDLRIDGMERFLRSHEFMAEAFPTVEINIGPGSMSVYLGAQPRFAWDTVWYDAFVTDWRRALPLKLDTNNPWLLRHLELVRKAAASANGRWLATIPDIIENVDILSAMRGPQDFCYDLIDEPSLMKEAVAQVDDAYFKVYDAFYDIVKSPDGWSQYTAFAIQGPGKIAKVQCDFAALMNPAQFYDFIIPSLENQLLGLDCSVFHLDGKDCIKHVDALMTLSRLNCLQWTAGAGQPDGGSPKWYPIYDKVRAAGKGLHISIYDGSVDQWISSCDALVGRYGPNGLYFLFPVMDKRDADRLINHAEANWM